VTAENGGLFAATSTRPARQGPRPGRVSADRPATVAELRRRADRAIGRRLESGKPLTAQWLGEAAGITDGAASKWLREHAAAGRLHRHPAPGGPAPYLDVYTRPVAATRPAPPGTTTARLEAA
jgi:hypothetical protein